MIQLSSKNDNSSFFYDVIITHQKLNIENLCDFSIDIDYSSKTDVFMDVIYLIIIQCEPRNPKGASGEHKVSASRAVQSNEARLYIVIEDANMVQGTTG